MVLHHVPQRAGFFIITAAAAFHAEVFGAGDLDVADVAAVPKGFENRVGETQHHQVLRGFLAEIMVDPIGVAFVERVVHHLVQMLRGGEVRAERFFHDHARPATGLGLVEPGVFQCNEDLIEELGSGCDIEQTVAFSAVFGIDRIEFLGQAFVACRIGELRGVVANGFNERFPDLVIMARAGNLAVQQFQPFAEFRVRLFTPRETDDFHAGGKLAVDSQIIKRRDELAVRQVSGGTEDDDRTRLGGRAGDKVFAEGIHFKKLRVESGWLRAKKGSRNWTDKSFSQLSTNDSQPLLTTAAGTRG